MVTGGVVFLVCSIGNGCQEHCHAHHRQDIAGIGVGFTDQSVPVHRPVRSGSPVRDGPAEVKRALRMGFQLAITIGILVANIVTYGTNKIKEGWGLRISLGLAVVPAVMMTLGSLCLPDTPNTRSSPCPGL
ncbi:hypothetical protein MLD38_002474 [Melastoma candidum]|uniref:Uncharacterized protein n=1 Tax=Melastoma candidum TaxID=119954 RepID=A0ACB9RYP5_9MYRT|nr:hypothetical protein MLD38_002474 [Melastoma candidum]